ncbi:MAG: prepilin-type N-terminal cleavage/methylation domain-containing protein [Planctomycetota bacterium]|nr:prepilin-type N-terminal cleavage/methylation domain-containing protein [Planctomycetota bacterium]
MNENKGFTLVELAISVAIIGVLAAIAIPANSAAQKRTLKLAGDDFARGDIFVFLTPSAL